MNRLAIEDVLRGVAQRIPLVVEDARIAIEHTSARLRAAADGVNEASIEQVAPLDFDAALARVRAALAANAPGSASLRDTRLVLRRFWVIRSQEGRALLKERPTLWRLWVRVFFAQRAELPADLESDWCRLLDEAPQDLALLDGQRIRRGALMTRGVLASATAVAGTVPHTIPLVEAFKALTQPGLLEPRWEYTSLIMALIAANAERSAEATWQALVADPWLEAMLLPRDAKGSPKSRLRVDSTPLPSLSGSLDARVLFAAKLLERNAAGQAPLDDPGRRAIYFQSADFRDPRTFRDPRNHPDEPGWERVRKLVPDRYSAFIDALVNEDISLFFGVLNIDEDRKRYWQQFARSASSTMFFLSGASRDALQSRYGDEGSSVAQVLKRARKLAAASHVDAFALRFGSYVVVEFSTNGNAAYLYDTKAFEEVVAPKRLEIPDLKRGRARERLLHHSGWQRNFDRTLAALGIWAR